MSVAAHAVDRLGRAEHLATERVVGPQRLVGQGVHPVLGLVLGQGELLEDHLALGLDLVGPERRRGDDVGQQVEARARPRSPAAACSTRCAPGR